MAKVSSHYRGGYEPSSNSSMSTNNQQKNKRRMQTVVQTVKKIKQQGGNANQRPSNNGSGGAGPKNGLAKITSIGRGLRNIGGFVGGVFQQPGLGRAAGATISRIFGQGDYLTNNPVRNSLMTSGVPAFGDMTSGFRVKHREYLQDIKSSVNFESSVFAINPGVSSTFPWLSTVAANFEEYIIHGAVVYLNTTAGASVASTNTALGLWGVVTQYDPSEPAFPTKQQAENYVGCQSAVPSQSLMHGIECKPRTGVLDRRYIRTGDLDSALDIKFYDWGNTQVFTSGSQNANVIGELWISYDVEFFKPRLHSGGYRAYSDLYNNISTAMLKSSPSDSRPLGTADLNPDIGSNLGTMIEALNRTLTFKESSPEGYYFVQFLVTTTAGTAFTTVGMTTTGSCKAVKVFQANSENYGNYWSPGTNTAGTRFMVMCVTLKKTGSERGYLQFNLSAGAGDTTTNIYPCLFVTQINPALVPEITRVKPGLLLGSEVNLLKELLKNEKLLGLLKQAPEEELDIIEEKKEEDIPASTDIIH